MNRDTTSKCLNFAEIRDIIAQDRLELLGRSPKQQAEYQEFCASLKRSWASTTDYLLASKFNAETVTREDGKRFVIRPLKVPDVNEIKVLINDFPYNFERGRLMSSIFILLSQYLICRRSALYYLEARRKDYR